MAYLAFNPSGPRWWLSFPPNAKLEGAPTPPDYPLDHETTAAGSGKS